MTRKGPTHQLQQHRTVQSRVCVCPPHSLTSFTPWPALTHTLTLVYRLTPFFCTTHTHTLLYIENGGDDHGALTLQLQCNTPCDDDTSGLRAVCSVQYRVIYSNNNSSSRSIRRNDQPMEHVPFHRDSHAALYSICTVQYYTHRHTLNDIVLSSTVRTGITHLHRADDALGVGHNARALAPGTHNLHFSIQTQYANICLAQCMHVRASINEIFLSFTLTQRGHPHHPQWQESSVGSPCDL